jgi:hypothetical protein
VLTETAVGGTALLWLTGLWGKVKRGFFVLTVAVALGCALLAALVLSSDAEGGGVALRPAVILAAGLSAALGLGLASLILRLDRAGFLLGLASVPVALGLLVALGGPAGATPVSGTLHLLAGAAFMGAVMNGLLLGHWYLVDRRLGREPINRLSALLLVAVILEAAAVASLGFGGRTIAGPGFSPYLSVGGLATWLALGMVACTALIAVLIRATLRGTSPRAVQAATGFFYLAVITAFTAEMAAKVRLLG